MLEAEQGSLSFEFTVVYRAWLGNPTDSVDMSLSKVWEMAKGRGASCAAGHGVSESDMTYIKIKISGKIMNRASFMSR